MTFDAEAADLEPEPDDDEDGPPVWSSSCGQEWWAMRVRALG